MFYSMFLYFFCKKIWIFEKIYLYLQRKINKTCIKQHIKTVNRTFKNNVLWEKLKV